MDRKKAVSIFKRIVVKSNRSKVFEVKFGQEHFVDWIINQFKAQEGKCYYCNIKQEDISRLIESGGLASKRFKTRGRSLEVERLDSKINSYSAKNCVLACYFCNNDKSDIVSSADYIKFFAKSRRRYMKHLISKLKKN